MGLSIADVDKWNPDSLSAVGAASTARASAAAEANSALRGSSAFDSWEGTGANAAQARTQAHADTLDGHGRGASAVATAAKTAANEVRQVKSQLSELRSTLGQYGITVDANGNRVVPPTNLSSLPPAFRTLVQGVTKAGQQSLDQIRQAADHADGLLADALTKASEKLPMQGEGGKGDDKPPHRWTDKNLYPHDPTADDVNQDSIGDCYLDATMGAIANANPQWIKDRIKYDPASGNFDVTLWDGKQWKHITVTQDDIDTNIAHHGASWLDNGRPDAPLWPTVLENAYAKLKAPERSLGDALDNGIGQGGYPQDALEALTGNRGTVINPQNAWLTRDHLDQEIAQALANHQPVTIGSTPDGSPIHNSHAYTVEKITGTGSDAQVTLRNPWNSDNENPTITVRLGDLIGSGIPGINGHHPTNVVNIGSLG